jgi:hypothetical protein
MTKDEYYAHPAISNSSLDWILPECGGSPLKYEERVLFPLSDDESAEKRLGSLAHTMIERKGLGGFSLSKIPSPSIAQICNLTFNHLMFNISNETMLKKLILESAKSLSYQPRWKDETIIGKVLTEGKDFLAALDKAKSSGNVLVSAEEMLTLTLMMNSLSKKFPWLFHESDKNQPAPGQPGQEFVILREVPLLWNIKINESLECKSLIDLIVINKTDGWYRIYDFKTFRMPINIYFGYEQLTLNEDGKVIREMVRGKMYDRMVHRQLQFYSKAVRANGIIQGHDLKGYVELPPVVIGCETIAPYECSSTLLSPQYRTLGDAVIEKAITLIENCNLSPEAGL